MMAVLSAYFARIEFGFLNSPVVELFIVETLLVFGNIKLLQSIHFEVARALPNHLVRG